MRSMRALLTGVVLGLVLATANVYLGLKVGFWDSGGIIAVLLAFVFLRGIGSGSGGEAAGATVVSQTLASSAAAMPGTIGLLGAIPALAMLGEPAPVWLVVLYGISLGVLGLVVGLLFREPLLVTDALPFPTGVAIAETVQALRQELDRWAVRAALVAALFSGAVTWLRDGVPSIIPRSLWLPFGIGGLSAQSLTVGVSVSPLLAGFGLLIGIRNGLGLLAGALVAWVILAPLLVDSGAVAGADYGSLSAFLLWPGLAMMVGGGLVSLAGVSRSIGRALAGWRGLAGGSTAIYAALAVSGTAVLVLARVGFGVPVAASAVILVGSIIAALVCARAVGEAGIAPAAQLGQIAQLGYGVAASPAPPVDVAGGSIVAGTIVQTSQMMESFRVGQIIGVPPARQAGAALIGVAVGTLAALPAYLLLAGAYGLGSEALPVPFAISWKSIAELAASGTAAVPDGAGQAALIALIAGAAIELLSRTRRARFIPSSVVIGLAFLIPAEISATVAVGALLGAVAGAGRPELGPRIAAAGAGAIAGESVLGVLLAALTVSGLL